jgi:hypothetical protein
MTIGAESERVVLTESRGASERKWGELHGRLSPDLKHGACGQAGEIASAILMKALIGNTSTRANGVQA